MVYTRNDSNVPVKKSCRQDRLVCFTRKHLVFILLLFVNDITCLKNELGQRAITNGNESWSQLYKLTSTGQ